MRMPDCENKIANLPHVNQCHSWQLKKKIVAGLEWGCGFHTWKIINRLMGVQDFCDGWPAHPPTTNTFSHCIHGGKDSIKVVSLWSLLYLCLCLCPNLSLSLSLSLLMDLSLSLPHAVWPLPFMLPLPLALSHPLWVVVEGLG